jgi:hypothetical protein
MAVKKRSSANKKTLTERVFFTAFFVYAEGNENHETQLLPNI